jgi:hypothetical protein
MIENDASKPKGPNARSRDTREDIGTQDAPIDPCILSIARALGRQIARERGAVESGRSGGGNSYGYDVVRKACTDGGR